ncbi:Protein translocase subunit SecF [hydrothermal vent metagenome]|uniref:Protein translocase subunit SecF n=1 Tax=hydrothermal vent metagenome TaxID=652676 RepID=A0A3B0WHF4_9ZZZZ
MSQAQVINKAKINFMGKRKLAMIFSLLLMIISIGSLATKGLNLGIDFTGGYLIEAGYQNDVNLEQVRAALAEAKFKDAQVQNFGSSKDIIVRIAPRADINKAEISDNVLAVLQSTSQQEVSMRRVEFVGPQVGDELRDDGGIALLVALGGILIYISLRFQLKSAVGAILALVHDVVITVGIFSILQLEFDLTVLASILAVIGYSLNDTVVVLDRIRETFRNVRKTSAEDILNLSINQTLSRTLVTSLTTLLVLFSLFYFGGEIIHGFATALIIGVVVGTYSSIYIASSTLMIMKIHKQDFLVVAKEEIVDDAP